MLTSVPIITILSLDSTVADIHNFKGSTPGVLFRAYPGPWQVCGWAVVSSEFFINVLQLMYFSLEPTCSNVYGEHAAPR